MFAPAIRVDGAVVFINPTLVQYIEQAEPLTELAPDGKQWPSCKMYLTHTLEPLHLKGSPQMILNSWFGPASNAAEGPPQSPSRQEESRIVMPGLVKIPGGKFQS